MGDPRGETGDRPDGDLATPIGRGPYLAHRHARAAANRTLRAHRTDLRHPAVLGHLAAEEGPAPQRGPADRPRMDRSTVNVIDGIERQEPVVRRRDARDRRRYAVHITDAGRTRPAETNAAAARTPTAMTAPPSTAEQRRSHELPTRFIAHAAGESAGPVR